MIGFKMIGQCAGIQKESQFMIILIGLSGVQRVLPDCKKDEFRGFVRQSCWKKKEKTLS